MTQIEAFYRQQAENCSAAAASSTLENQRVKYLHAQAAWEALASASGKARIEKLKREEQAGIKPAISA